MLILICGHSRAGKTTFSQRFKNVIHLDDVHSFTAVIRMIENITDDVVVEGIYYSPRERKELLSHYRGTGARVICIDTSQEVREARMKHKFRHSYPFLYPTYEEGWDKIIIIRSDSHA